MGVTMKRTICLRMLFVLAATALSFALTSRAATTKSSARGWARSRAQNHVISRDVVWSAGRAAGTLPL